MSQKSVTTTTSFIVSSEESLNKPALSTRSIDSGENYVTNDDLSSKHLSSSLNTISNSNGTNNMALNQHLWLASNLPPTANNTQLPPPPYSNQAPPYGQIPVSNNANVPLYVPNNMIHQQTHLYAHGQQETGTELKSANPAPFNVGQKSSASPSRYDAGVELTQTYQVLDHRLANNNAGAPLACMMTSNPTTQQIGNGTSHPSENLNRFSREGGKSSPQSVNSSINLNKQSPSAKRTSTSSQESASMPINVKSMLLHGVDDTEVIRAWLKSIKCEEYVKNFIENGYDMPLLSRITPQDLIAIGCKTPALRKRLLLEIKKLNLEGDIPDYKPTSLNEWLELLKLSEYLPKLCSEGYNTIDKVCELTWEDLEEIGIYKLGHQKRLLLGIERIRKLREEKEENNDAIYDVHPNHRVSLNPNSSDNRVGTINRSTIRSGFFQTRSGANLDHRGLPVAVVTPALKHVNRSLANLEISQQSVAQATTANYANNQVSNGQCNTQTSDQNFLSEKSSATIKRNPPLPPVRTNSLKVNDSNSIYGSSIYGTSCGANSTNGNAPNTMTISSTSFLRTPKLGTLTATTNQMLTHGGHLKSVISNQSAMRPLIPVREVPLPPIPPTQPVQATNKLEDPLLTTNQFNRQVNSALISPSLIGHQIVGAEEFPPPPPAQ